MPPTRRRPDADAPPRAWQRMLSGRRLDLLDPSALDIEIEDIAHGLARVARWNGQTIGPLPFSVAQHSVIVEELCAVVRPDWPTQWKLAALLHDAPEYVIGDLISPFKHALGGDYRRIERRLQQEIHVRFSLPRDLPPAIEKTIKQADRACAFFEATQIAGFKAKEARDLFGDTTGFPFRAIVAVSASDAQAAYVDRFRDLSSVAAPQ